MVARRGALRGRRPCCGSPRASCTMCTTASRAREPHAVSDADCHRPGVGLGAGRGGALARWATLCFRSFLLFPPITILSPMPSSRLHDPRRPPLCTGRSPKPAPSSFSRLSSIVKWRASSSATRTLAGAAALRQAAFGPCVGEGEGERKRSARKERGTPKTYKSSKKPRGMGSPLPSRSWPKRAIMSQARSMAHYAIYRVEASMSSNKRMDQHPASRRAHAFVSCRGEMRGGQSHMVPPGPWGWASLSTAVVVFFF